jgi:uncharacterized Zn-binding protein involved in type VI secretion
MTMYATTTEKGQLLAMPDVCLTPTPVPYPNIGMPPTANPVTQKVLICGLPALTKASKCQPTSGDEAGVNNGSVSGKIMGPTEYLQGSMKVQLEGNPAVFMGNPTKQNDGNAVGSDLQPSQNKVMIMS